jgi:trehalose 6-phosphate synthase/phosphatase
VSKGRYADHVLAELAPAAFVLAAGDDRTDDDLFRVVQPRGATVQIGPRVAHQARYVLPTPADLRGLLRQLLTALGSG